VAIEDVEVVILAIFEGRIQIFEYPDAKLWLEQSYVLEALADISSYGKTRDSHPNVPFPQDPIDACECLRGREVDAIYPRKVQDNEPYRKSAERFILNKSSHGILDIHNGSEEQITTKFKDQSLSPSFFQVSVLNRRPPNRRTGDFTRVSSADGRFSRSLNDKAQASHDDSNQDASYEIPNTHRRDNDNDLERQLEA